MQTDVLFALNFFQGVAVFHKVILEEFLREKL